jgi:dihydropteroate synthase
LQTRSDFTIRFPDGGVLELGSRTVVMGVINATPDSFSDGGEFIDPGRALESARRMVEAGAEILDIGGESTRPGAADVAPAEELRRVLPVLRSIERELDVRISIDTRRAEVAREALDRGAVMVNDVSALRDPHMLPLLASRQVPVVVMHMRGEPGSMQDDTRYRDLMATLCGFLEDRVISATIGGLADDKILVDPGIGFGKSVAGNLTILRRLPELGSVGRPIVIGASRKSFIGRLLDLPVDQRLEGSLAVAVHASAQGAHIVRVHDVEATVRAVRVIDAIRSAGNAEPRRETS